MKQILLALVGLIALQSFVLAEVPKSIFDDDWKPDVPARVLPPSAPVAPSNPPAPATPAEPTPANPVVTPSPATAPAAPVVTDRPRRLPIPAQAAQSGAWKLIQEEVYKENIANAKTPEQKAELARKLLGVARDTTKDSVGKYVLLAQAKELAISSGDPPTAFECLDELGSAFDINYPAMKLSLFAALAKTVHNAEDCGILVDGLNRWADGEVRGDRYDPATKACDIAISVATTNRNNELASQTLMHKKRITDIEAAYLSAKPAIVTLETRPSDTAANLTAGRFYCFTKGDWETGLPMLALGGDAGFRDVAQKELPGVSGSDAQMALGDAWWEIAEKESIGAQKQIRHHAGDWYKQAQSGLAGLDLAKVKKRLKDIVATDEATGTGGVAGSKWVLIFRSSDPAIWNTDSKDEQRFAIPLADVAAEIQFLKLQIDPGKFVIIAMSKDKLDIASAKGRYGWEGHDGVVWGGHQLGIFDQMDGRIKKEPAWVCIHYDPTSLCHSGWGFGHRAGVNDQGFAWNGKSIGRQVCEIYVTTESLSSQEELHLLK